MSKQVSTQRWLRPKREISLVWRLNLRYNGNMEFTEKQFSQFLRAVEFAAHKHRDQRRKGSDASPYINHPIAVAEILWRVGGVRDTETLIAALLHDTIEDTATAATEIEARFGSRVRSLVEECTDDKSLPKAERKRLQIAHAAQVSAAAKEIKLADKISNVTDIIANPPPDWSLQRRLEYLDWAEQVVAGLRDANATLAVNFDNAVETARRKAEEWRQGEA